MRNFPVFALPEVEDDIRAAIVHYASWRSDATRHVEEKYDETVAWIGQNAEVLPKRYGDVRRAILKRTYYLIYFVVEPDRALVLAVLDGRRDPTEIRSIIEERTGRTPRVV